MEKSVGRALESALKEKPRIEDEVKSAKHLFSNRHRRDIFSVLSLRPCIGASAISKWTDIKVNTVSWHLTRLMESGYVVQKGRGKNRVYYPEGLVNADEMALFRTLNNGKVNTLMHVIITSPGSSQSDLAGATDISHQYVSRIMAKLEDLGLTSNVVDGSHVRYYPSKMITRKAEDFYDRSKGFLNLVTRKLKASEGGEPSVVKKGVERIIIEMGPKKAPYTMEIGINPYITVFEV